MSESLIKALSSVYVAFQWLAKVFFIWSDTDI